MDESSSDEKKLQQLGEQLRLFSSDAAPHVPWNLTAPPFQMQQQEFVVQPSSSYSTATALNWQPFVGINPNNAAYSYQQPQQAFVHPSQNIIGNTAVSDMGMGMGMGLGMHQAIGAGMNSSSLLLDQTTSFFHQPRHQTSYQQQQQQHHHQRVPSIGMIDSETNPIAASLLMSLTSAATKADEHSSSRGSGAVAVESNHQSSSSSSSSNNNNNNNNQSHNIRRQPSSREHDISQHQHYHANNNNNNNSQQHYQYSNSSGSGSSGNQQHHRQQQLQHHHNHNSHHHHQQQHQQQQQHAVHGYYNATVDMQQPPPPPPPPCQQQLSDCWSPYNNESAHGSRPKFSDVVKKSLSDVASASNQQQQSSSRPVTPAPISSSGQQLNSNNAGMLTSPSVSTAAIAGVVQQLQNANFSLASSRSNLSRNGKPIAVAKVEPMQVTASRYQQLGTSTANTAPSNAPGSKVTTVEHHQQQQQMNKATRRTRSSTTGAGGEFSSLQLDQQSYGSGVSDNVFDVATRMRQRTAMGKQSEESERGGGGVGGIDINDEDINARTADDETDEGGRETENERSGSNSLRQRGRHSGKSSASSSSAVPTSTFVTTNRKQSRRNAKALESSGPKSWWFSDAFVAKIGGFLSQLGPWIVVLLAKIGGLFRYLLQLIVHTLYMVIVSICSGVKDVFLALRRLIISTTKSGDSSGGGTLQLPAAAKSQLKYMALLRQYGLARPSMLPTTTDGAIKRLLSMVNADSYSVIGCCVDAKQDDVELRIQQLARLVTGDRTHSRRIEEAAAVFRRVCNDLGSAEARRRYDIELIALAESSSSNANLSSNKQQQPDCYYHGSKSSTNAGVMVSSPLQPSTTRAPLVPPLTHPYTNSSNDSHMFPATTATTTVFTFYCYDCGLFHQLLPLPERSVSSARLCSKCGFGALHSADLFDLWAEITTTTTTTLDNNKDYTGTIHHDPAGSGDEQQQQQQNWRFLACLDVHASTTAAGGNDDDDDVGIFDVTDAIACYRSRTKLLGKIEINSHSCSHRMELVPRAAGAVDETTGGGPVISKGSSSSHNNNNKGRSSRQWLATTGGGSFESDSQPPCFQMRVVSVSNNRQLRQQHDNKMTTTTTMENNSNNNNTVADVSMPTTEAVNNNDNNNNNGSSNNSVSSISVSSVARGRRGGPKRGGVAVKSK